MAAPIRRFAEPSPHYYLSSHRTMDVLLFVLALAIADPRFGSWEEIIDAIQHATLYWNAHRHPFVWVMASG